MTRKRPPRASGVTHPGHVRPKNEDCFLADGELGLYLVLDGMGGHNAGDVASARARDVIRDHVTAERDGRPAAEVLEEALRAASAAVFSEAQTNRERIGMGTTVVACLLAGGRRAVLAHVGDSRAYLLRGGRLRLLTADHTVVSELLARGALSAGEAAVHPYKSVLSRNLGGRSDVRVDLADLELDPGDRVLLCSDGLSGFASHEAMEQVLAGAEDPERAAAELVELALRGGGGDNVTALVVELGRVRDSSRDERRGAAAAWWSRRGLFEAEARKRGVHGSPICAVLSPDEAVAIVAGNLCESIYHDLEQSAGLHVWTYAENLANGWLDQGGAYAVLRDLLDRLQESALAVAADVAAEDAALAILLETDLLRALVVAEMAVAGAIGEKMRRLEELLVTRRTRETPAPVWSDEKTLELSGSHKVEPPSPMVASCLEQARQTCRGGDDPAVPELQAVLDAAHRAALDPSSDIDLAPLARELYGTRLLGEGALRPLLDALGRARGRHLAAVRDLPEPPFIRAAALGRVAAIHEGLFGALALMVVEAAHEVSERYRLATQVTGRLRADLAGQEQRISALERELGSRLVASFDSVTVPDARRGGTES